MDAVQAPVVPIVGDIIRQVPGTISLGQGVVHYPPPRAAIDAARAALERPAINEYQDGNGLLALLDDPRQLERLRKEPALIERVDSSLIGGLVVEVEGKKFDASVASRLQDLSAALLARASSEIHRGTAYVAES